MDPGTLLPGRIPFECFADDINRLAENEVVNRATVGDDEAHMLPKTLARLRRSSSSIRRV